MKNIVIFTAYFIGLGQTTKLTLCPSKKDGKNLLCPKYTSLCSDNYQWCDLVSTTKCSDGSPFLCPSDLGNSKANTCVSSGTACCSGDSASPHYCPHTKKCVSSQSACCSLNPLTPFYCKATNACVQNEYECCSNLKNGATALKTCTSGGKCAKSTTFAYCFRYMDECDPKSKYSHMCTISGRCMASVSQCASPRVCPPGYTQCPDRSCIPGLNKLSKCRNQKMCSTSVAGTTVRYKRCPDGRTCVTDFNDCPTDITCKTAGHVVCPDGSCKASGAECVQPPACQEDARPYMCPGSIPGTCVSTYGDCPAVMNGPVCPSGLVMCENGQCAESCANQPSSPNCTAEGKVLCMTSGACADTYEKCPDPTFCPLPKYFTYSPSTVLCGGGARVCADSLAECTNSNCHNSFFYPAISSEVAPFPNFDMSKVQTCADGRCQMPGGCMTPFSCTPGYAKWGGFGEFCLDHAFNKLDAIDLAVSLMATKCIQGQVQCLSGECRDSYNDCPQETTCPATAPLKCRDGKCVSEKSACESIDKLVEATLTACIAQNKLLCPSDLRTCTLSLQHCPTKSTCAFGLMKCSDSSCVDPLTTTCSASSPDPVGGDLFCESSNSFVTDLTQCPVMTTCPMDAPVRCAADNICKASYRDCSRSVTVEQQSLRILAGNHEERNLPRHHIRPLMLRTNCTFDYFLCKAGCSMDPCPEWGECTRSNEVQCWDGSCVSDLALCRNETTGCPFQTPEKCLYTSDCVKNATTDCPPNPQTTALNKTKECAARDSNHPVWCELGYCAASESQCSSVFPNTCANWLYPNTLKQNNNRIEVNKCYQPTCPYSHPVKCASGLCVTEPYHCPTTQMPIEFYQKCYNVTKDTGQDVRVPCGDMSCKSTPDQCLPLYNCSINGVDKHRCPDGSCRASEAACYLQPLAITNICSGSNSYQCANGMCAKSADYCLNTEGCPEKKPIRCEHSGICMPKGYTCKSDREFVKSMNTGTSSDTFCKKVSTTKKITCLNKNGLTKMMFCVSSASECFQGVSKCSIDTPVRCYNQCQSKLESCKASTQSIADTQMISGFHRKPHHPLLQQGPHPIVGKSYTLNSNNCPFPLAPFRCSDTVRTSCKSIPYSSYPSLYQKTCPTSVQQVETRALYNKCLSSQTPIACGDGSCISEVGKCPSCPYFCTALGMCMETVSECNKYIKLDRDLRIQKYSQACPTGNPYRCINNGICVQSPFACQLNEQLGYTSQFYMQAFSGSLIDPHCSSDTPIRCASGYCVNSYQECIEDKVSKEATDKAFTQPIQWGAQFDYDNNEACQVYCQDGSCRDRQENCPFIQACSSPLKPYRCRSGLCAKDKATCGQLFGSAIEDEAVSSTQLDSSCGTGDNGQGYVRCEDGICRPAQISSGQVVDTCLKFMGCPRTSPYQCASGHCTSDFNQCKTYSRCPSGKYSCKNMKCVDSAEECASAAAFTAALSMEVTFNPYVNNTIVYAYHNENAVARLHMPANSISVDQKYNESAIERDIYQRLVITPQPESSLESKQNKIRNGATVYMNQFYGLNDGYLSYADTVLSPTVEFSMMINNERKEGVNAKTAYDGRIEFKLDDDSMPKNLRPDSDLCIGQVLETTWACLSNSYYTTEDGFKSFPISSAGKYALIVNPDPTLIPDQFLCDWWCANQLWVYIGGGCFIAVILLVILLLLCCRHRRNKGAPLPAATTGVQGTQEEKKTKEDELTHFGAQTAQNRKQTGFPKKTTNDTANTGIQRDSDDDSNDSDDGIIVAKTNRGQEVQAQNPAGPGGPAGERGSSSAQRGAGPPPIFEKEKKQVDERKFDQKKHQEEEDDVDPNYRQTFGPAVSSAASQNRRQDGSPGFRNDTQQWSEDHPNRRNNLHKQISTGGASKKSTQSNQGHSAHSVQNGHARADNISEDSREKEMGQGLDTREGDVEQEMKNLMNEFDCAPEDCPSDSPRNASPRSISTGAKGVSGRKFGNRDNSRGLAQPLLYYNAQDYTRDQESAHRRANPAHIDTNKQRSMIPKRKERTVETASNSAIYGSKSGMIANQPVPDQQRYRPNRGEDQSPPQARQDYMNEQSIEYNSHLRQQNYGGRGGVAGFPTNHGNYQAPQQKYHASNYHSRGSPNRRHPQDDDEY